MIGPLSINLGPGLGVKVDRRTSFLFYASGNAAGASTRLRIRPDRGGADLLLSPGDLVRLAEPCSSFSVLNEGTGTIVGELVVGEGQYDSTRTVGTVEVIDGSRSRVLASRSFITTALLTPPAGQYSRAGIYNPPGSNTRLIGRKFFLGSTVTSVFWMYVIGYAFSIVDTYMLNKLSLGAGGQGRRTFENSATLMTASSFGSARITGNSTVPILFEDPFVIQPGNALVVENRVADA
ncbi:MAG: hypothetical protein ACOYLX_00895, partial [Burkholderiaceae bacterium]